MTGHDDFRVQRFHQLVAGENVRDRNKRSEIDDAFHIRCGCGEKHSLFRQPDRRIRFAVNVFQIQQLEGPLTQVDSHLVFVLDMRRDHAIALHGFPHLGGLRGKGFDSLRIRILFHSSTGSFTIDDDRRRREDEMIKSMVTVDLGIDEEPDGLIRKLFNADH